MNEREGGRDNIGDKLTVALLPVLPPAVSRFAEARRHSQLRFAHLVLLLLAGRVLTNDAGVDPE